MSSLSLAGLLLLLLHLAGILAAIDAVRRTRTTQGAIAWAVLLLSFPYFALIPYLIFGNSRFEGYVKARQHENLRLKQLIDHLPWQAESEEHLKQFLPATAQLTQMPPVHGNQVRLLINGEETFNAIFAAIKQAKYQILVQFYTIADDSLGERLANALLERAAQGVHVYLLCDEIGSNRLPNAYIQRLKKGGINAYKFITQRGYGVNRFQINFRNHRKLVVVDGQLAYIGGHNVSELYLGLKPPLAPWRDTHIELQGPIIGCLQYTFAEDWYWSAGKLPELRLSAEHQSGHMICQALPFGPADRYETCMLALIEMINQASHRIWLTSPYLIADEAVNAALMLAVARGVEIRILVPSRADHMIVYLASQLSARYAVKNGIAVYRYKPGFIHEKVWLFDDQCAVIGSANLDNRSMRLNFEQMVAVFDKAFAQDVEKMLLEDFSHAQLISQKELAKIPKWRQALQRLAYLFGPIL